MKFFWYSILFILSEPSTCTSESTEKIVENGNIVEGGNDRKGVNSYGWCNLTQPIAFQTWSDFLDECKYSKGPSINDIQIYFGAIKNSVVFALNKVHIFIGFRRFLRRS
jgi:hypothetical protein